jgi:hypothetical protein
MGAEAFGETEWRSSERQYFNDNEYSRHRTKAWTAGTLHEQTHCANQEAHARNARDATHHDGSNEFAPRWLGTTEPSKESAQIGVHCLTSMFL